MQCCKVPVRHNLCGLAVWINQQAIGRAGRGVSWSLSRLHQNTGPIMAARSLCASVLLCSATVGVAYYSSLPLSLPLSLLLDLVTHHTVPQGEPEGQRRAQSISFFTMAPLLIDPFYLASNKRPPWGLLFAPLRLAPSGHEATRLSPGPSRQRSMANRSPPNPWILRICGSPCPPPRDRDPPLFSGRLLFPQWNSLYHSTKIRLSLQRCQFLLPDAAGCRDCDLPASQALSLLLL